MVALCFAACPPELEHLANRLSQNVVIVTDAAACNIHKPFDDRATSALGMYLVLIVL
jgi:hypothetical protein